MRRTFSEQSSTDTRGGAALSRYRDAKAARPSEENYGLHEKTTAQIDALIRGVHARAVDFRERVQMFSHLHMGVPFQWGPLLEMVFEPRAPILPPTKVYNTCE